jgi:phage terminase small subunit
MARKLTDQKKVFCEEYLLHLNGTKATEAAGYSKKAAKQQAYKLLGEEAVQEYIQQLMAERSERTQAESDEVINELSAVAFTSLPDIVDFDGQKVTCKSFEELTPTQRKALKKIKIKKRKIPGTTKGEIIEEFEIELLDKLKSLELLGRHLAMFTDRTEHIADINIRSVNYGTGRPFESVRNGVGNKTSLCFSM